MGGCWPPSFKVSVVNLSQQTADRPEPRLLCTTEHAAAARYEAADPRRAAVCIQGGSEDTRLNFVNGLKPQGIWRLYDSDTLIPK